MAPVNVYIIDSSLATDLGSSLEAAVEGLGVEGWPPVWVLQERGVTGLARNLFF